MATTSTGLSKVAQRLQNCSHQCLSPQVVSQLLYTSPEDAERSGSGSPSPMVHELFNLELCFFLVKRPTSASSTHLNTVLLPFAAEALFIQLSDPFPREYSSHWNHSICSCGFAVSMEEGEFRIFPLPFSVFLDAESLLSSKQSSSILSSYLLCIDMIASHLILHL